MKRNTKQFLMNKNSGFTLIEMLLTIVVLAILLSLAIVSYSPKLVSNQTEKASLEMMGMLQAASEYYRTYDVWPDSGNPSVMPQTFIPFLPLNPKNVSSNFQILNPWGWPYQISHSADSSQFTVTTQVPNNNIAQTIAQSLPYGTAQTNTISASLYNPITSSIVVKGIGQTGPKSNDNSFTYGTYFSCPQGSQWTPDSVFAISMLQADETDTSSFGPSERYCQSQERRLLARAFFGINQTPGCSCANTDTNTNCQCYGKITLNSRTMNVVEELGIPIVCDWGSYNTKNFGSTNYSYLTICRLTSTSK